MNEAEDIKRIFRFYFSSLAVRSGINWDSDNDAEIDAAIDMLIRVRADNLSKDLHEMIISDVLAFCRKEYGNE